MRAPRAPSSKSAAANESTVVGDIQVNDEQHLILAGKLETTKKKTFDACLRACVFFAAANTRLASPFRHLIASVLMIFSRRKILFPVVTGFPIFVLLFIVAACGDEPTSSFAPGLRPNTSLGFNPDTLIPPSEKMLSLGSGPASFESYEGYKGRIVARATISGGVTAMKNWYPVEGQTESYQPGGSFSCELNVRVGSTSGSVYQPPCGSETTSFSVHMAFEGGITVSRGNGLSASGAPCGYSGAPACFIYSGGSTVRIEPVAPTELKITANFPNPIGSGYNVKFTMKAEQSSTPGFPDLPMEPLGWEWEPLSTGVRSTPQCYQKQDWCQFQVFEHGYVIAYGLVNGVLKEARYRVETDVPQPVLACTPSSVMRLGTVTCQASMLPTAPFSVTRWKFSGSDFDVELDSSNTTWEGPIAASGMVTVTATVQGVSKTATAKITVTPRDWSTKTVQYVMLDSSPSALGLTPYPKAFNGLGQIRYDPNKNTTQFASIDRGPNAGVYYATEIPKILQLTVSVNTVALQPGSEFWQLQDSVRTTVNDTTYCGRADLPSIEDIYRHEGRTRADENSHLAIYVNHFEQIARTVFEDMVGKGDLPWTATTAKAHFPAFDDAKALDNPTDTRNTLIHPGCEFRYFQ